MVNTTKLRMVAVGVKNIEYSKSNSIDFNVYDIVPGINGFDL